MTFVEQITKAFEELQKEKDIQRAAQWHRTEALIKDGLSFMGMRGVPVVTQNRIECEGVTFRAVFCGGEIEGWQVHGECMECYRQCWSYMQTDLAGIGEMYLDFKPNRDHRCGASATPTAEQKLIAALRALIDERMQE